MEAWGQSALKLCLRLLPRGCSPLKKRRHQAVAPHCLGANYWLLLVRGDCLGPLTTRMTTFNTQKKRHWQQKVAVGWVVYSCSLLSFSRLKGVWFRGSEELSPPSPCQELCLGSLLSIQTWDFLSLLLLSISNHLTQAVLFWVWFWSVYNCAGGQWTCTCVCTHPHVAPQDCTWLFGPALNELSVCFVVFVLDCIGIQYCLSRLFHHVSSQQEFSKEEGASVSGGREMRVRISQLWLLRRFTANESSTRLARLCFM